MKVPHVSGFLHAGGDPSLVQGEDFALFITTFSPSRELGGVLEPEEDDAAGQDEPMQPLVTCVYCGTENPDDE